MTRYTAHARMGDRYWLVHVTGPDFDHTTQARNLGEVEPMGRDLVAIMRDVDPASIALDVVIQLPDDVRRHLDRAEQLRRQEAEARAQAALEFRIAVAQLVEAGMAQADVARALGVSKQRVSQLAKAS